MKPFLLVSGDFVTTGGMDRANYALAMYLARIGHPVHLVAHRAAPELTALPNVQLHRVPKPANSYFLGGYLLDRCGRYWARRLARQGGRVVVNGGNCRFGDVNWVHYVHAADRVEPTGGFLSRLKQWLMQRVFRRAERQALRKSRLILANSWATRSDLVDRLAVAPDHIEVVYLGIDLDRFRPATIEERRARRQSLGWPIDRPVVAFVGGLGDRRKGFDTLFAAWQSLCADSNWDADLAVIGTGIELQAWRRRAMQHGLSDRVYFLGFRSDVPELLPVCDLLVAPTRYEAYGLGVHEALCCAIPAMVSRSAGVAERYPDELDALLIQNPDDGPSLVRQLRDWRSRAEDYRTLAEGFSRTLRDYTWDSMAERIVSVIGE